MRVADLPFVANGCFNRTLGDTAQLSPLSAARAKVAHSSQGFVEIMKSVKGVPDDDEDEEEEYLDGNRDNKKEGSSHKGSSQQRMQLERFRRELSNGDVGAKVDGKNTDQRASTPRSKHSATEQRRRSKINERFQILRELVPHSDHKRDKASFLLEVIDYIQILQEKVQKYEVPCQGWNQDKMKMMPWKNSQGPGVNTADHSRRKQNSPGPGFIFTGKFDGSSTAATPEIVMSSCNPPESDSTGTFAPYKNMELHPSLLSKAVGVATPLQPCVYTPVPRNSSLAQHQQRLVLDVENMATPPQPQFQQRPFPVDCPIQNDASNEQEELVVEGGMISISSLYSQGLLGALTQALQSSGLDLSQANISVQIDLGKQGTSRPSTTTSSAKDEEPSSNRAVAHSRAASSGGDSEQAQKRPKTDRGG